MTKMLQQVCFILVQKTEKIKKLFLKIVTGSKGEEGVW
jgi:hypothetical protein